MAEPDNTMLTLQLVGKRYKLTKAETSARPGIVIIERHSNG